MKILSIDTSTDFCSAALWIDGRVVERGEAVGQDHSERLFPMIAAVLGEGGTALASVDAVAFGAGPGSFTGLRIACGVAQGIGFASGVPLVPVGTLAALAFATGADAVAVALDARMGEVYLGAYRRDGEDIRETLAVGCWRPDDLPDLPPGRHVLCGSALVQYADDFRLRYGSAIADIDPLRVPHARDIARIAAARLRTGGGVPAHEAAPVYVRDKVALTVAERKAKLG